MIRRTLIKALLTLSLIGATQNLTINAAEMNDSVSNTEWQTLIKAISAVESSNNPKAVNGHHVGLLQISPVCVRECNRIVGYKRFSYNDRFSAEKSIEMFNIIQGAYNPERNHEKAARLWNGGQGGVKHPERTNGYWRKVSSAIERIKNGKNTK